MEVGAIHELPLPPFGDRDFFGSELLFYLKNGYIYTD
jgi:hypothetical protein